MKTKKKKKKIKLRNDTTNLKEYDDYDQGVPLSIEDPITRPEYADLSSRGTQNMSIPHSKHRLNRYGYNNTYFVQRIKTLTTCF